MNRKYHETLSRRDDDNGNFCAVAARLIEAACFARQGDCEAAKAHIARAIALLRGEPSAIPTTARSGAGHPTEIVRGGLAAWQKRRLTAYIDTHLTEKIRVEELAKLLELSESHFSRVFRCAFGTSVHEYLSRRRIEMAQGLMLATDERLCAIALCCGMSDQSHFSRLFHRIVGETPYVWRLTRRGYIEDRTTERLRESTESAPA